MAMSTSQVEVWRVLATRKRPAELPGSHMTVKRKVSLRIEELRVLGLGEQDLDSWHRPPKILRIYCLFLHMDDHRKDPESCRMGLVSPKNQPRIRE